MSGMILTIGMVMAVLAGVVGYRLSLAFAGVGAAGRLAQAEAEAPRPLAERFGASAGARLPGLLRNVQHDLYWAAFANPAWERYTPAYLLGRALFIAGGLGMVIWLGTRNLLWTALMAWAGWYYALNQLRGQAERVRRRIEAEIPDFVLLVSAETAAGVGLLEALRRVSEAQGYLPAWFRRVLQQARGRNLFTTEAQTGVLRQEAQRSGHPALVNLAMQLEFASQGMNVQELLEALARRAADEFHTRAEQRAEELRGKLVGLSALFYMVPFFLTVLALVIMTVARSFA